MKTRAWKILATTNLLALAMFGLTPSAGAQINYAISGNTAYVTNSPNASGNIVIASTYDTYPVTSIGDYAFDGCLSLTGVTIPSSVTSIGTSAFEDIGGLMNVTIPNSVTNIGDYAFFLCSGLTSVTIPSRVTSIGLFTFYESGLTNVTIPNSVTIIGYEAFYGCSRLTSVTLGSSVTNIDPSAFQYCSSLTSVTIPDSVINITSPPISSPFLGCIHLTNITVTAANTAYASAGGVLFNKAATLLIQYPEGLKDSYTIPNSVTSIGLQAFDGCGGLTNVAIPDSVTNIGSGAFAVSGLTSVTIPSSVTSIGDTAFYDCSGLTNVAIPNSLTSIGVQAFSGCYGLTSVTIPDSVTSIGQDAFGYCSGLTNINVDAANSFYSSTNGVLFDKSQTMLIQFPGGLGGDFAIPDSVTSIGDNAFYDCSGLTSVTIPDSVTNIGYDAFSGCYSLTSVTIPDSVTSIGTYVFYGCSSLANVVIGTGITNVSYSYLFYYCRNLHSVSFLGNAPTADSTLFYADNLSNITVYYAPGTTGWDTFASATGVTVAPAFGSATYAGQPVIFYPTTGATNTLQMSTNSASGNWVTVSNAVTLAALQLTNPPAAGFFRLQSSGGTPPSPGLALYFNLPVLFYPTNVAYSLLMATNLPASSWSAPSGSAFISVEITNAPPGAVFRLY